MFAPETPSPDPSAAGGVPEPLRLDPFTSYRLGPLTLRNRIVKAATFEGVMPKGTVSDDLVEYHRRVAAGGAAMSTVAYLAISPGGRVHRHTLVLDRDTAVELRRLTDAVHAEGAAACAQIGHAGLVANVRSNRTPTLAPSTRWSSPAMGVVKAASPTQIDEVVEQFAQAALMAIEAGFDAVEVHLGHNYLPSSFFSPNLNKRTDDYGGSIENRARFPRRIVEATKRAVGDRVALTAKFNMADGVKDGLWLDESLQFAQLLEADGHLDAIQLTGGSSLLNGMYYFRGDVPMKEFIASQPPVVSLGLRVMGRRIFPELPFEEAFFLPFARQFRAELSMPLMLLGGINRLDTIEGALGEGFELVAMARALLREPDLPNRMRTDPAHANGLCVHCNKCLPTIYTGTRCVLVPPPA
jgi:2,4-dienoyl-CoA reductase-like NADH-dependent reductase (Old Yellow Enzyme family)